MNKLIKTLKKQSWVFWFWVISIIGIIFLVGYKLGLHRVIGFMNA